MILDSIDDFREHLLTPEEASIEAGEMGDPEQIAHAELYELYDQHLTDNALIDYPRMINLQSKRLQQMQIKISPTLVNTLIF